MTGITVTRHDDRLIAVKRATADGCERRHREAHLLARLSHPGVVQFVDLVDGDPTELHMSYAGTDSWERQPPSSEATIIDGLAAVAATVADLHDLGTAHCSLAPDHVLITADQRPVLCGLADADTADPITCADDLSGLASLIDHLSPAAPTDLRARLDGLSARARAGDLSARGLTDELDALRRRPGSTGRFRRPGLRVVVAASATGALLLLFGWLITRPATGSSPADPPVAAQPVAAAPATPRLPPTTTPPGPADPTPTAPPPTAPAAETLGEPMILIHGGRRFGLGQVHDVVLLGDWNCDGIATPALLETELERIAIFLTWPAPGESLTADSVTVVAGASDLQATDRGGCDEVRVLHPLGSTLLPAQPLTADLP